MLKFIKVPSVKSILYFSKCNCATFDNVSFFKYLRRNNREIVIDASHPNGIGVLAMNRQKRRNAFSRFFVRELSDGLGAIKNIQNIRVLIICSLVPNVFSAGADLYERADYSDSEFMRVVDNIRSLFQRLRQLPIPTIAAIDGAAFGSGLQMALACDLRYAGILPKTQLGCIESHWSLMPGVGGTQSLPRLVGSARAKELMFCARRISAHDAANCGLVNAAVDPAYCEEPWKMTPALWRSIEVANQIALQSPSALRQIKRAVNERLEVPNLD